ncbi:G patch domain-containing protein 8 [Dissophora globulifera]|nr:G patch domain-containing protein 8 [Dissophora globulifera]
MQRLPTDLQSEQAKRFYRQELEELAQIRDTLRAKHRPGENDDSDYDDLSDEHGNDDGDRESVPAADMETHIPVSNVGYKLLLKMGWKAGTGLGQHASGRTAPIPIERKQDVLGIGKQEVDTWYTEWTTTKRRATEVEKQAEETEEARLRREKQVEQQMAIKAELNMVKSAFYCALCDKQYERISDYEVHLSSYDHNHKKRFKEMKDTSRAGAASTTNKIKEKERKREERELAKLQEAAMKRSGGTALSISKPPSALSTPGTAAVTAAASPSTSAGFQPIRSGFQPVSSSSGSGGSSAQRPMLDNATQSVGTPSLSGGFQPVKVGGFQPVKAGGLQQLSGFQSVDDDDVDMETPPLAPTNSATPAATGFQPVKLGGFKPMKIGGFQLKKPGAK